MNVFNCLFCFIIWIGLLNIFDSGVLCSSVVWLLLVMILLVCSSIICLIFGIIFLMWWVISIRVMFWIVSVCMVVIRCWCVIRFRLVDGLFSSSVCGWLISVWVISICCVLSVDSLV